MSTIAAVVAAAASHPTADDVSRLLAAGRYPTSPPPRVLLDGQVALGASILHLTAEDTIDEQPLAVGRLNVVLAGRLDNRDELIARFGAGDGRSDVALATLAYQTWGIDCAKHLVGAFALLVWDSDRHHLFCAVDHLAQRPLYYAETSRAIVVASTIRQLRGCGHVRGDLDEAYLLARLWLPIGGGLHSARTPYTGIRRMLPGTAAVVRPGGPVRTWRYWRPEDLPEVAGPVAELGEQLRERLEVAVRAQSRTRGKVMCTLSGGLDSSSITGLLTRMARKSTLGCRGFETVSVVFDDADADERDFLDAAERHFGIEAHRVDGRQCWHFRDVGPGGDIPLPDEPAACYAGLSDVLPVARLAEQTGCTVALFGLGGDELLTGNNYLIADLIRRGRALTAARYLRLLAHQPNRTYAASLMTFGLRPLWRSLRRRRPRLPGGRSPGDEGYGYHLPAPPWLTVDSRRRRLVDEVYREMATGGMRPCARSNEIEIMRGGASVAGVLNDTLFYPLGIEVRNPFYDRRVVELALSMSGQVKLGIGDGRLLTKCVLRAAMRHVLPAAITTRRSKANLVVEAIGGLDREWRRIWNGSEFQVVRHGLVDHAAWTSALRRARMGGQWDHSSQLTAGIVVEFFLRESSPSS